MNHIRDYLQTQALTALNAQDIALSRLATQTVIANARAHIEPQLLQHPQLPEHLAGNTAALARLFMALDAAYSRHPVQSATLYALLPEYAQLIRLAHMGAATENLLPEYAQLIRLAHMGAATENLLPVSEENAWHYLAVRTAQSGWANIADHIARWLEIGELRGSHNRRAACQTSLPVCGEDGAVYGVLHLEHAQKLSDDELAAWVGLALGMLPTLSELLPHAEAAPAE